MLEEWRFFINFFDIYSLDIYVPLGAVFILALDELILLRSSLPDSPFYSFSPCQNSSISLCPKLQKGIFGHFQMCKKWTLALCFQIENYCAETISKLSRKKSYNFG